MAIVDAQLVRAALAQPRVGPPRFPPEVVVGALPAGVVVALRFGPTRLLVVERASHLTDHAGELGFPGGKPDAADVDLRATAARELEEECGVGGDGLDWLGELAPCPVITGRYLIHPFVAALPDGALPRVASGELARVHELSLDRLLDGTDRYGAIRATWRGVELLSPHFTVGPAGAVLYGASASIAFELLARVAVELGVELPAPVMGDTPVWGNRYDK